MLFDRKLPRVLGESWVAEGAREEARAWYRHSQWWGQRYHTGIDFARQTDYTVIFTIYTRVLPARVVYFKRLNRVSWESIYAEAGQLIYDLAPHIPLFQPPLIYGVNGDLVWEASGDDLINLRGTYFVSE